MKVAICSDIHLEIGGLTTDGWPDADVLVLAGDILVADHLHKHPRTVDGPTPVNGGRARAEGYRRFIGECSQRYSRVVAVAGNHEFYDGNWIRSLDDLRREYSHWANVHFLERDTVDIGGVKFIGATLWTDMNRGDPYTLHAIGSAMNDFRLIRHDGLGYTRLRPAHCVERHKETLAYFRDTLTKDPAAPTVVVSHMAPSSLSIHDRYRGEVVVNGAYHSDLSGLILDNPQIKLWCHGHMHNQSDYMIGVCRVVCNPRGYVLYERGSQEEDPYHPHIVEV